MTDEVSKSGKPASKWNIRDDGVPVEYVDLITEGRHVNGVVYLSFASGTLDGRDTEPLVRMTARLRMNLTSAQFLNQLLERLIRDALKPADTSQAN